MNDVRTSVDLQYRVGAGALGMFMGLALGLAFAVLAPQTAPVVFGGAGAGAVTGFAFPQFTMRAVEALVHFVIGLVRGARDVAGEEAPELVPPKESQEHNLLAVAFVFGVVFAAVVAALL